ncbi:cytochrome-c peroxidase [Roseateles sp.]|uniref:cytochrome-c peroxidase n=1 Tax=Roseateles sp. TaxID=1971397 RepID=UPI0039E9E7C1
MMLERLSSWYPLRSRRWTALTLAALLPALAGVCANGARDEGWSAVELATLASMRLDRLGAVPPDPGNAVADLPEAAGLGRTLFFDTRFSRDGRVSCASCHDPRKQFQDGRPVGLGIGEGVRRTMPIANAAHSPWLFWDGRKDSLWSQALGPLEDGAEHGSNRTRIAQQLLAHHREQYEQVFGAFPPLTGLPEDAGPAGTPEQRQAWERMSEVQRDAVNRVFANLGKAVAAYERTVVSSPSRFDRYVRAVEAGDAAGRQWLALDEVRGLRLFIGKAQCATCHNGPLFSDQHFHNTGVPPRLSGAPDRGRASAIARVQADEFNCLGRYSDADAQACGELSFIAADDPGMEAAFRTPSLRNVALRAPYMHGGQLTTLDEVVAHYRRSPPAVAGVSELAPGGKARAGRLAIRLDEEESRQIVAFLRSLSDAVDERPSGRPAP